MGQNPRFGRRVRALVPVIALGAALLPVTAARATTYPSASIVTPTQGTSVSGLTQVTVHAQTDPAGLLPDKVGYLTLYVDGTVAGGENSCAPHVADCTLHFLFDWSGYTGSHTEQVKGTTDNGVALASQLVTVSAVSPPPSASISSPGDGSTLTATDVPVVAHGVIDASQDVDFATSMALRVDGTVVQSSYCAGGFVQTCAVILDWDTSATTPGAHTLTVVFTTSLGKTATSAAVHVTLGEPPPLAAPTIHIDTPADGTNVTGLNGAHVTGTTDPAGSDVPDSTRLYLDGNLDSVAGCAAATHLCSMNHLYDVSGLTGTHTLQATMTTEDGVTVSSQVVSITAVSPPPTVTISSPVTGATVTGAAVEVDATGTIDPHQSFDYPQTLALLVDGHLVDSKACGVASMTTCSGPLSWTTAGSTATQHTLQVTLTTTHGLVGSSPVVTVTLAPVGHQPQVAALALDQPRFRLRGATGMASGRVTLAADGSALGGVPVTVTFTPPRGAPVTVAAVSGPTGRFAAVDPDRLVGNTHVLVSVGSDYGSASASETLPLGVRITCTAPASSPHGQPVLVTCRAPGLAYHSVVTLHYAGKTLHGAVSAKTSAGIASFTLRPPGQHRWVTLWATTATTRLVTASRSRNYAVRVV